MKLPLYDLHIGAAQVVACEGLSCGFCPAATPHIILGCPSLLRLLHPTQECSAMQYGMAQVG